MTKEIIIFTRSLPHHSLGGMEIVTWDLARALARTGSTVRVITTSLPEYSSEFEEEGVTVVALENTPSGKYSSLWWDESQRYFEKNCLHTTQAILSVSASGFGILPLKDKLPGIPIIMQAHGTSLGEISSKLRSYRLRSVLSSAKNFVWLPKDLLAYRKFDSVVAVGERVLRDLGKAPINWFLSPNKVHLINNGIDTDIFKPSVEGRKKIRDMLGIDESTPVIISASRLHEQKNILNCIKAFFEFKKTEPKALYLIAGDGPERETLKALANELGISDSVRFIGSIDRKELATWLHAADIFLFLTKHVEGLPLNVLEALASGLPAVVSEHLMLFESSALHYVSPNNFIKASQILKSIFIEKKHITESSLPEIFSLSHAAERYSDVLYPKSTKKNTHAYN